jgi:hypothetical protein
MMASGIEAREERETRPMPGTDPGRYPCNVSMYLRKASHRNVLSC